MPSARLRQGYGGQAMKVIADLQLHSRFSRAVSPQMVVPVISEWAAKKGIGLIATGDWTHPLWFRELEANLEEAGEGVYKANGAPESSPLFLLSTEISSIYSQAGKVRKIHTLIFAPNFEVVGKINKELTVRGANLLSDGRPIVGLSAKAVAEIALGVDSKCLIIPAHAWTPHFSLFGSISGFDSIAECFQELSPEIYAIETGLSSDPAMNWRIEELTNRRIVSFSDAHSPPKLGREATVFEVSEVSFPAIRRAITGEGPDKIAYTIEFYPEEGKYHYTGHRNCNVVYSPNETRKLGTACPVCGRPLTVGVMSRVEALASQDVETKSEMDGFDVRWIKDSEEKKPPYVMLVPLLEILSEALGVGVGTQTVLSAYEQLATSLGSEFKVLLETNLADIERVAGPKVAEGISKVRSGDISIEPGYDGVFGKVKIWKEEEVKEGVPAKQETLF
ncbi:MAG: endonuclease Q family protein [Patescibacteria group bacterium]